MDTITTGEQIMGDGYLTEALNRGWGDRDSQSFLQLQQERAGVPPVAMTGQEVQSILSQHAESACNVR
jgi:hypothetical protein